MKWHENELFSRVQKCWLNKNSNSSKKKTGRWNGKSKGVDETHFYLPKEYKRVFHKVKNEF